MVQLFMAMKIFSKVNEINQTHSFEFVNGLEQKMK